MMLPSLPALLARPAERKRALFLDLGRTSVFLFGVLVVTGALLSLYYRPSPDGAFESVVHITDSVHLGWFVRSLHRVAGHAMVVLATVYTIRGFFGRLFLKERGPAAWRISVAFAFTCLAFLLSGEALPWNQTAYWQTVVNTNLVEQIPFVGGWMADVIRGGTEVTTLTVVRLYAIHALLLPWVAFGLLALAREVRKGRIGS